MAKDSYHIADDFARGHGGDVSDFDPPPEELVRLLRPMVAKDRMRPESEAAALRRELLAVTEELLERQAHKAPQYADLIERGLLFPTFYKGIEIDIFSGPAGPEFIGKDVALALGCAPPDIGVTDQEFMTLDAVEAASANRGSVGARFRKWLKKTIRPNDDEWEITPEAIRDGLMVYGLIAVRSKSGKVIRLKQQGNRVKE
jgi:hypothetical protein